MDASIDLLILGGGINGCGIAREAALRGLSVVLVDSHDIAAKTSSSSTKLIHGGLRYLEQYEFALVKKSLDERQRLLTLAPHLVRPLPFFLPCEPHMRSPWLLRAGLFIYDHLSVKNTLPRSQWLQRPNALPYFSPFKAAYQNGFLFYDASTDDARLTLANALQAKAFGARILPRTRLHTVHATPTHWQVMLQEDCGRQHAVFTKAVVNATGPWVNETNRQLGVANAHDLSFVKGSHIVVPALYPGDHACLLQPSDKRVIFVIPYHGLSLIGTTEIAVSNPLENPVISEEEIHYLLDGVNQYFKKNLQVDAIRHTWSGVRPLIADTRKASARTLSRDYALDITTHPALTLTVYGGKITTHRQLSVEALQRLSPFFPPIQPSRSTEVLLSAAHDKNDTRFTWLPPDLYKRLSAQYGARLEQLLKSCTKISDLGAHFGHGLYACEVDYLVQEEWAVSSEDILWRRTKLGLWFNTEESRALDNYLNQS